MGSTPDEPQPGRLLGRDGWNRRWDLPQLHPLHPIRSSSSAYQSPYAFRRTSTPALFHRIDVKREVDRETRGGQGNARRIRKCVEDLATPRRMPSTTLFEKRVEDRDMRGGLGFGLYLFPHLRKTRGGLEGLLR